MSDSFGQVVQVQKDIDGQVDSIVKIVQQFITQSAILQENIEQLLEKNEINVEELQEINQAMVDISKRSELIETNMEEIQLQASSLIE